MWFRHFADTSSSTPYKTCGILRVWNMRLSTFRVSIKKTMFPIFKSIVFLMGIGKARKSTLRMIKNNSNNVCLRLFDFPSRGLKTYALACRFWPTFGAGVAHWHCHGRPGIDSFARNVTFSALKYNISLKSRKPEITRSLKGLRP